MPEQDTEADEPNATNNLETRDPTTLTPHPYNAKLYRQTTPSERFIQDIAVKMEEKPIINEDDEIIDGVRRWLASLELGWDSIDVIERSYPSFEAEKAAILRHNDDRNETFSQKVRVALRYKEEVAPVLEKRMKAGKSANEIEEHPLLESNEGDTANELAADLVGWGGTKLWQAEKIWEARHDSNDAIAELARELVQSLDDPEDKTSVNRAKEKLDQERERQEFEDPVRWSELNSAGLDEPLRNLSTIYQDQENNLDPAKEWTETLATLKDEYEDMWGQAPRSGDDHTFVYRLEEDGYADLGKDSFAVVDSISERKPDRDTLVEFYWTEDTSLGEIAIRYGVSEELVEYWLKEEDIDRKKRDFSESERKLL